MAALTGVEHERTGWPFRCTVHAPHSAMPQPYLVPVMSRRSRSTQRSGVSGSASTLTVLPLMFREIMGSSFGKKVESPPARALAHRGERLRGIGDDGRDVDGGQLAAALEDAAVDHDGVDVRRLRRLDQHVRRVA